MDVFLSEAERRRAERLKSDRQRRRFVASRGQLRRILASRLGISPSDVELEYGQQGKPHLSHRMPSRNLRFSVSRSQDVAVIALSTGQEVGVDIEAVLPIPEADDIARCAFPPPTTSLMPPSARTTGWKASSGAGPGWRLSPRAWDSAWDTPALRTRRIGLSEASYLKRGISGVWLSGNEWSFGPEFPRCNHSPRIASGSTNCWRVRQLNPTTIVRDTSRSQSRTRE